MARGRTRLPAKVAVTEIELEFADGAYTFALKLPQLAELQEKCGAGIFTIYGRLLKGRYILNNGAVVGVPHEGDAFVSDIYETIRLGLIGGGQGIVNDKEIDVGPMLAKRLVERYVHTVPIREAWTIAAAIMSAKIEGYDPGPKAEPAAEPASEPSSESPAVSTRKRRSSTAP